MKEFQKNDSYIEVWNDKAFNGGLTATTKSLLMFYGVLQTSSTWFRRNFKLIKGS